MKMLQEVRKEDDSYYQGAFWIIGNSVKDIKEGRFQIIGKKNLTDFEGNYQENILNKNDLTHKRLWDNEFKKQINNDVEFNYYPRGRVAIYQGVAYIHLHSLFNQPDIIDKIVEEYNLQNLEKSIDMNDTYQGSHYDFLLK